MRALVIRLLWLKSANVTIRGRRYANLSIIRDAALDLADLAKELQMNLKSWDVTINQIADESNQQPQEAGKQKVLFAWRAKLAKEPTSLPPFQIDQIVREVRKKLVHVSH
jgi:hypothetical protein